MIKNIITLWKHLGKKRRTQYFFLFALTVVSVFAEVVSIGAVIPFLSALTAPDKLMVLSWFQPIIGILGIESPDELLLPLTVGFIAVTILAAGIRILVLWANTYLSAKMGIQLRNEVFSKALHQPYEYHVAQNSSKLISVVTEKIGAAAGAGILHVLMLLTSLITAIAIIVTLLVIDIVVALTAFGVLGGGYLLIGYLVRKRIKNNGEIIARNQPEAIRFMQEGLGGIRDIIIDNSQNVFTDAYTKVATHIQMAGMRNSFLGNLPKSLLEMMGITIIAAMAYYLQTKGTGGQDALPILGALAIGAQRLLPTLQQVYFSWSTINATQPILADVLEYLDNPININIANIKIAPLRFSNKIDLKQLYFQYKGSENSVLKNISLSIKKGSRIGFIGATGSGKSTLLDIFMGLLLPTQGQLIIDDTLIDEKNIQGWQANIAHVPQSIYLSDASISQNIAFGVPIEQIDKAKVAEAARKAYLHDFIKSLPGGYDANVGERGVQLSGGQRQRIGIARALYKNASVIVFDEATSALDEATEKSVMEAIDSLEKDLTLLIVAHRLSTLKVCDKIFRLDEGIIVESGTYEKIVG